MKNTLQTSHFGLGWFWPLWWACALIALVFTLISCASAQTGYYTSNIPQPNPYRTAATILNADCQPWVPPAAQERTVTVSNVLYVVRYALKNTQTYNVPLTNPLGQAHYDCTATIHAGTNKVGVVETQWTPNGCFEDSPMLLLGRVLKWERYPDNSASPGHHWVVKGPAMWSEPDAK
jgi:hypothetical protein